MLGFLEFTEEKKITVKTKMGGEIPATIKVTGKDYHIVKADASGKQYKVDHQGNSLEEEIELSEEQLDELKKSTLASYVDKAAGGSLKGVAYHAWDAGSKSAAGDKEGSEKAYAKAKKRSDGIQTAAKKLAKEETDKDLPFTPDAKKTKPSTPGKYGDAYSTARNLARRALEKQAKKNVKEEAEELEELDKSTLASYVSKSAIDVYGKGMQRGSGDWKQSDGKKLSKRVIGIQKAAKKLAKEEVQENHDDN